MLAIYFPLLPFLSQLLGFELFAIFELEGRRGLAGILFFLFIVIEFVIQILRVLRFLNLLLRKLYFLYGEPGSHWLLGNLDNVKVNGSHLLWVLFDDLIDVCRFLCSTRFAVLFNLWQLWGRRLVQVHALLLLLEGLEFSWRTIRNGIDVQYVTIVNVITVLLVGVGDEYVEQSLGCVRLLWFLISGA